MLAVENAIRQCLVQARRQEILLQRFTAIKAAGEGAVGSAIEDAVVEGAIRYNSGW
jgi:hypothetical protein